eukprot:UN24788
MYDSYQYRSYGRDRQTETHESQWTTTHIPDRYYMGDVNDYHYTEEQNNYYPAPAFERHGPTPFIPESYERHIPGRQNSQNLSRSSETTEQFVKVIKPLEAAKPKKKHQYRSKQIKIDQVLNEITEYFIKRRKYTIFQNESLLGEDCCRVHVKNRDCLDKIVQILKNIENTRGIQLKRIATPIIWKNGYKKKAFLVYMKLRDEGQVKCVQRIFRKHGWFEDCKIAKRLWNVSVGI